MSFPSIEALGVTEPCSEQKKRTLFAPPISVVQSLGNIRILELLDKASHVVQNWNHASG